VKHIQCLVMNSSLPTKFRRVMVLESDHSPQKLRPAVSCFLNVISEETAEWFCHLIG
jgi:hypothetical protein